MKQTTTEKTVDEDPCRDVNASDHVLPVIDALQTSCHDENKEEVEENVIPNQEPQPSTAATEGELIPVDTEEDVREEKAEASSSKVVPEQESSIPVIPEPAAQKQVHTIYETKRILFGGIPHRIILQNINGPCPVIAVTNALILKGQLNVGERVHVSFSHLNALLADCFFRLKPAELTSEGEADYAKHIEDAMSILPSLGTGLDVNVRFSDVKAFEFTPALSFFDLLGLNLFHGWLPDPQLVEIVRVIQPLSYNEAIVKSVDENFLDSFIIRDFLHNSASQLTYYGLEQLNQNLSDGEVAVLFRNNHFSTIYKRQNELFLLCTDSGFSQQESVVWETLSNTEGDSVFVNHAFQTFRSAEAGQEAQQAEDRQQRTLEDDFSLAMHLQEQERVAAADAEHAARMYARDREQQRASSPRHHPRGQRAAQSSSTKSCSIM